MKKNRNVFASKILTAAISAALLLPAVPAMAHTLPEEAAISTPAADLRVTLDQLLAEHAYLAVVAMQKGADGAADFGSAAEALNRNTVALSQAIASVYGKEAGDAFQKMWSDHIGFFVDYVTATAGKDEAGRKAALAKLAQYRDDFAGFLAGANPKLNAQALANGLQMHVNQLVAAFDSYVNKDYEQAYANVREAYHHMFGTGDALSTGIVAQFPDTFHYTTVSTPASDLRVVLNRLLAEHAVLAVTAMQKGVDGAPDFAAAAGALNANTGDLSAAIASVYGKEAGETFEKMWSEHIGFFVDYVTATAGKDEAGRQAALDQLAKYRDDFAAFLAGANPNLNAQALADGLQQHVEQLVSAFDSYVRKDYATTYSSLHEAYGHMFMTGDALAGAIVKQYPERFAKPDSAHDMTVVHLKVGSNHMMVNDETVPLEVAPFLWQDTTYVSLRALAEAVGAEVTWDETTWTAQVRAGADTVRFTIDSDTMTLNGMAKPVGAKVILKDGRTQVPLRVIAELLGWDVTWNNADWSVKLTKAMMMH